MAEKANKKTFFSITNASAIIFVLAFVFSSFYLKPPSPAHAQDVLCIGPALADYVASVFDELGATRELGNVKFLSPAFNMSHPEFENLVNAFAAILGERGYDFNDFYAVAGNAYNTPGGNIRGWIDRARSTAIGNSPLVLTETGFYPPGSHDVGPLPGAMADLQTDNNIVAALLFNVFGANSDLNFAGHVLSDEEVNSACNGAGSCGKIGANSARYYSSPVGIFYDRAQSHGMRYTLEIATNNIVGLMEEGDSGIPRAQERGIIPILRLGVGMNSGGFDNPEDLAGFIQQLSSHPNLNGPVYVIIGPNEPISECWATPECDCDTLSQDLFTVDFIITMEWPPDPATFYIAEKGNTDLIEAATYLVASTPGFSLVPGYSLPPSWVPTPNPVPPPVNPDAILDVPDYRQYDDDWKDVELDSCSPPITMERYGCGPTSMAMIISFLYPERQISPGTIGEGIDTSTGVVCAVGSAYLPIANWLKNERGPDNYNDLNYTNIGVNIDAIAKSTNNGHPVIVYCSSWGGSALNWNHISVIEGIDNGFVYFQDPIRGEIAYSEDMVMDEFNCVFATSF